MNTRLENDQILAWVMRAQEWADRLPECAWELLLHLLLHWLSGC